MDRVELFRRDHDAPLLVVARPDRIVRGRRLDQSLSRYAPYSQDKLALNAEDTAGPA